VGKHIRVKDELNSQDHFIEYIELSKLSISPCTACEGCTCFGVCVLPNNDDFSYVLSQMIAFDALFFITPVYAPIPSKLAALFERLLSISFFGGKIGGNPKPLLEKKVAMISYGASKIYDSKDLKIMTQQFFTNDYSFSEVNYSFIGSGLDPSGKELHEYVQEMIDLL
jgi:multimeric flavodoxin WrbA